MILTLLELYNYKAGITSTIFNKCFLNFDLQNVKLIEVLLCMSWWPQTVIIFNSSVWSYEIYFGLKRFDMHIVQWLCQNNCMISLYIEYKIYLFFKIILFSLWSIRHQFIWWWTISCNVFEDTLKPIMTRTVLRLTS